MTKIPRNFKGFLWINFFKTTYLYTQSILLSTNNNLFSLLVWSPSLSFLTPPSKSLNKKAQFSPEHVDKESSVRDGLRGSDSPVNSWVEGGESAGQKTTAQWDRQTDFWSQVFNQPSLFCLKYLTSQNTRELYFHISHTY